jgi:pyruvate formate lyase activating enzyme
MRFGGFQPFTLSDFPGRTAAIAFTQGCNFRCPYCHNGALLPMLVPEENLVPESVVLDHLRRRRMQLDGLVVTGGEPTLQPALPVFLRKVKGMGFLVKLDTNGSSPGVLKGLLDEELVDFVAMDIKAPSHKYSLLAGVPAPLRAIEKSIALIKWSGVEHQFRTTHVPELLSSGDLQSIVNSLPDGSAHVVQRFRPEHALDLSFRSLAGSA